MVFQLSSNEGIFPHSYSGIFNLFNLSLNTAVNVNGIFWPAQNVQKFLGDFSFNLLAYTHDETNKVRLLGSATPIIYHNNYLVLCTAHQIRDIAPEDIGVFTEDGKNVVTSSGHGAPAIGHDGMHHELQDIVVFNFNGACEGYPSLKRRFFKITTFPPDCASNDIIAVLNYGYPSSNQLYEVYDKNRLGSCRRGTTFQQAHSQPHDETLLHLKPLQKLSFDPNGLSGGPNFVIQRARNHHAAYFGGVTVRAGINDLYIVKSGSIKGFLDTAIDQWN